MHITLFNFLSARPIKITSFCLILVFCLCYGIKNYTFSNDFRVYFSEQNPQLRLFERFETEFSKQAHLFFGVVTEQDSIFNRQSLELIDNLSEQVLNLPYTYKVYSLSTYQYVESEGDTIKIDDFYDNPRELNDEELTRLKRIALNDPSLLNYYISSDEKFASINVNVNLPEQNLNASPELLAAAENLRDELLRQFPGHKIVIGGSVASNAALSEGVKRDLITLVPASYLIIVIALWILLRNLWAMFATLVVVTLSVLATFGVFGFFHLVLTPISGFVPSVVLTLAIADCVHILVSYRHALEHHQSKNQAIQEALRINITPIFLTSFTTMIGVLCLNFSDSPPYHDLGNMVAVGVFWAWLFSMLLLPCLMLVLPMDSFQQSRGESDFFLRLADFVSKHQTRLLLTLVMLILFAAFMIQRNKVTENWLEYFDESFAVSQSLKTIETHLDAIHRLEYLLESKSGRISDHEYLHEIKAFETWLRQQPEVSFTTSLIFPLEKMHRLLRTDTEYQRQLPKDDELLAQYILLYELSANDQGLGHLINFDHRISRLTVFLTRRDSADILAFENKAKLWLSSHTLHIKPTEATSLDIIFAHIAQRNIYSLLSGTLLALVLISCLLLVALRSIKLGLISLIPNLVPALLAYGTWGLFVGYIDMALSIVICMSLGIVVDDTVHFLSKYRRARIEKALDGRAAVRYAFQTVGSALVITTVVLVAGFSLLVLSGMTPTRGTGILLALTLIYALIVDFLLLPVLLLKLDK